MREDIYGGIKNALERGDSLDQAVMSFVNAGYKETDVIEVAKLFESPTSMVPTIIQPSLHSIQMQEHPLLMQQESQQQFYQQHGSQHGKWFAISLIILLGLVIIAFAGTIIFRQELITWLQNVLK